MKANICLLCVLACAGSGVAGLMQEWCGSLQVLFGFQEIAKGPAWLFVSLIPELTQETEVDGFL